MGSDILDPEVVDVATSKPAVERQIEERQVPCASGKVQSGSIGPYVSWLEWRFWPNVIDLVPGPRLGRCVGGLHVDLHCGSK